jgi:MarR family transcriptional repressor of mepA
MPFPKPKIVHLIRQLGIALVKSRNKALIAHDLTAVQADVIAFILKNRGQGEINLLDVQRHLAVSHPTVVGIVSRLERKGLLSQARSARDARFVRLEPTSRGLALAGVLRKAAADAEARIARSMTKGEREEFQRLLEIALRNADG